MSTVTMLDFTHIIHIFIKKDNPAKRPEVREKLRQAALRREQKKRGAEAPLSPD